MRLAVAASALLHVGLVLVLLGGPLWSVALAPEQQPTIEVVMVDQGAQSPGAPAHSAAPTPTKPPPPSAADGTQAPPPPPDKPEQIRIGSGLQQVDPLQVTADSGITPAAPDSRFRNLPPAYPMAAARLGAAGTVQLLVRVSAAGVPAGVEVAQSSGFAVLDQEAQRAVALWRFRPAMRDGRAVPFDYLLNITFKLDGR